MTLEEIYYIGQTIAVVAIFGSLVYVAIQTRQNGRLMRAKAAWDAQTSFAEVNDTLADGDPVSQVIFKLITSPDSLTDYEKYMAHRHTRGVLLRAEAQYALYKSGILDAEVWRLQRGFFSGWMNFPMFNEIWQAEKANSVLTQAFIAEMDKAEARDAPAILGTRTVEGAGKKPA